MSTQVKNQELFQKEIVEQETIFAQEDFSKLLDTFEDLGQKFKEGSVCENS